MRSYLVSQPALMALYGVGKAVVTYTDVCSQSIALSTTHASNALGSSMPIWTSTLSTTENLLGWLTRQAHEAGDGYSSLDYLENLIRWDSTTSTSWECSPSSNCLISPFFPRPFCLDFGAKTISFASGVTVHVTDGSFVFVSTGVEGNLLTGEYHFRDGSKKGGNLLPKEWNAPELWMLGTPGWSGVPRVPELPAGVLADGIGEDAGKKKPHLELRSERNVQERSGNSEGGRKMEKARRRR